MKVGLHGFEIWRPRNLGYTCTDEWLRDVLQVWLAPDSLIHNLEDMLGYAKNYHHAWSLVCYIGMRYALGWIHFIIWILQSTMGKKLTATARKAGLRFFLPIPSLSYARELLRKFPKRVQHSWRSSMLHQARPRAGNMGYHRGFEVF